MLNTSVQNNTFPLAGLMYALRGIAHTCEGKVGITVPANASSSFSRRDNGNCLRADTLASEAEFSEPLKNKLLPTHFSVYGYSAPAKSGAGIGVLNDCMATYDAPSVFFCVVNLTHPFFSDASMIRVARKVMVGWVGAEQSAPESIQSGYANPAQSTTSEIGVSGGGYANHCMEAAAMLATTPTQNPQFIWLIAAVRRDCPIVKAVIHHIAAVSEYEARRSLTRDHICFFAGRIRIPVVCHA